MEEFKDIWNEYYPKLTVYLRTSFHFNDTEDLLQEIMLKVHTNLHKYKSRWSFNTWIYSIARNHAVDSLKRNTSKLKITEAVKSDAAVAVSSSASPESILIDHELQTDIAFFINGLPEAERQLAFLKYHEEMKYKDISRVTGIPTGTIKYYIHNIKKKFSTFYGEHYED